MHECLALITSMLWIYYGLGLWHLAYRRLEMSYEEVRWGERCFFKYYWGVLCASCEISALRVEKNLLRWQVRRDGMRWEELRWGEKTSRDLRWDEVWSGKCKCEVWCIVKCEESVCLALHCTGVARRSCSWTTTLQQLRTKHARTGLAGARRMQVP